MKHGVSCDFEGGASPYSPPNLERHSTADSRGHYSSKPSHFSANSTPGRFSVSSPGSVNSMIPIYSTPSEMIRSTTAPGGSRMLELKLMHHFTARTSQTLSETADQQSAWRMHIPSLAYETDFLMDAILAVSALHLRSQTPNDQAIVRASHSYMASALAQYSTLLNGRVSALNAEALFATSALIAFQASAGRFFEEDKPGSYTLPLAWFHSFQGVKAVVMASWQWLRTSEKIYPIINGQPALALDPDPHRKLFFSTLLDGMDEDLLSVPESMRAVTKQAYQHSISFLNWSHVRPVRARILGFAAAVSRRFVDLIDQCDPRALVIVACFFALTKRVDDVWWLKGVAKREVNGIFSLLPPDWWPKMEWPLMIANHEGEITDDLWGIGIREFKVEDCEQPVYDHIDILAQLMADQIPLD